MKTIICYFSGTGNSFVVARDIAEKTGGKLLSIPAVMDRERVSADADAIGIVFPVFFRAVLGGIPAIVSRFVGKLENLGAKYVFAVATYGLGGPNFSMLAESIRSRGGELAAAFAVKMPFYYLALTGSGAIGLEKQRKLFDAWKEKSEAVCLAVAAGKKTKVDSGGIFINAILVPIGKAYYYLTLRKLTQARLSVAELLAWIDAGFRSDDCCDGCGICARICPVANIEMTAARPTWQHRCEQCCACLQRCPKEAITLNGRALNRKRFRPPEARVADISGGRP